eukprot:7712677-Pyramimonas_sp.AAC.1
MPILRSGASSRPSLRTAARPAARPRALQSPPFFLSRPPPSEQRAVLGPVLVGRLGIGQRRRLWSLGAKAS